MLPASLFLFGRPQKIAALFLLAFAVQALLVANTRPLAHSEVDTALRGEWARCGLLADPEPEVLGCGGGQRHVAVTPEGDVYPCSHLRRPEYRMGNLLNDSPDTLCRAGTGLAGLPGLMSI